jgi:hypothetical protein
MVPPEDPRVAELLTTGEFKALCAELKPFMRAESPGANLPGSLAAFGQLAREQGWSPTDIIKALHASGCYPGNVIIGQDKASRRYARALDRLLHEYFRNPDE